MMSMGITISGFLCAGTSMRMLLMPLSWTNLANSALSFLSFTNVLLCISFLQLSNLCRNSDLQNGLQTERLQMIQISSVGEATAVETRRHFSEILDWSAVVRRWRATVVHGHVTLDFDLG